MIKNILWRLKLIFKIQFDALKMQEKVLLYVIPLLLIYLLLINFDYTTKNTPIVINNVDNTYQVDVLEEYENLFDKLKVRVIDLQFSHKELVFTVNSNFVKLLHILNTSQYKIKYYKLYKKNKKLYLDINLDISEKVKSNNQYKKIKRDPFKSAKKNRKKISQAIIGSYVLLGNKWYEVNDKYKKYKIIQINATSIVLQNKEETITKVIFDE
jgi:hypothetical protein